MKSKIALALIATALVASTAMAQLPPEKWWRAPKIVETLALTQDQQDKLEGIFRGAANDLIDRRADLQKATIALRNELDQTQINRQNVMKAAARVNDARGKLFERELMMLTDMRSILTDTQWDRMRAELDRHRDQPQPRPQMRDNRRPPRPDGRPDGRPMPRDRQPLPPGNE